MDAGREGKSILRPLQTHPPLSATHRYPILLCGRLALSGISALATPSLPPHMFRHTGYVVVMIVNGMIFELWLTGACI